MSAAISSSRACQSSFRSRRPCFSSFIQYWIARALTSRNGSLDKDNQRCCYAHLLNLRSDIFQPIIIPLVGDWRKLTFPVSNLISMQILTNNVLPHPFLLVRYRRRQDVDHRRSRLYTQDSKNMTLGLHPVCFAGCEWIICRDQMRNCRDFSVTSLTHHLGKSIAQRKGDRCSLALLVQNVRYASQFMQDGAHHVAFRDDLAAEVSALLSSYLLSYSRWHRLPALMCRASHRSRLESS
jgi:hypothetical protein